MKTTLLLTTLLFSFNAIGAEPKFSKTGLEGWGENGVRIVVVDYTKEDKSFPIKAIHTKVESRLRQAGIKVTDDAYHDVNINAQPILVGDRLVGYAVRCQVQRPIQFHTPDNKRNLVTYDGMGAFRGYNGICGDDNLIKFIDSRMDKLLLDYLKANPKKKE